jgi:hypothetical protein
MMFNSMWKGIFLCVILLVGDPFITLKAETQSNANVTLVELAQYCSKT